MSANAGLGERPLAVYTDLDDTEFSAGVRLLEAHGFEVRYLDTQDEAAIVAGAQGATAMLVGYATITRSMIEQLPDLEIIALMSMGFNNIDVEAAAEHGVWVTNIPGAATEEVATHALALALHVTRGLSFYSEAVMSGRWNSRAAIAQPRLSSLTLGILGLGKIGSKLAELAKPLFGEIVGYDPFLPDSDETRERLATLGVRRASLEEVRDTANVLSLHVPLTPDTHRFVDADFLAAMPTGSYLVNVSRGQLIDSAALRAAIDSGHLSGAGLDVLDEEPPSVGHPLVGAPGVTITAHIAYYSDETDAEYVRQQAQNVLTHAEQGRPDAPVNTPIATPRRAAPSAVATAGA
jgi:phosphoglycerate dehydrogenase-like enzyme